MNFLNPKKFWRARTSARAPRIFVSHAKKQHIFDFSAEIGSARAPKIFLSSEKIIKNPSATFFFCQYLKKLTILAQFEVLTQFRKNRYFGPKFDKNRKFSKFFIKKSKIFHFVFESFAMFLYEF